MEEFTVDKVPGAFKEEQMHEIIPGTLGFMPRKDIPSIKPGKEVCNTIKHLNYTLDDQPSIPSATHLKRNLKM